MSLLRLIGFERPEEPRTPPPAVNARRHGRVRCENLTSTLGEILDMSASGTRIVLAKKRTLTPGEIVEVAMETYDVCLRLSARVVWTRKTSARRTEAGLQFLNLTPEVSEILASVGRAAATNETLRPEQERAA